MSLNLKLYCFFKSIYNKLKAKTEFAEEIIYCYSLIEIENKTSNKK